MPSRVGGARGQGRVRLGCQEPGGTESQEEQLDLKAGGTDISVHVD